MHPPKDKLKAFVEGKLERRSLDVIKSHINSCPLCQEFCENYRLLVDSLEEADKIELPPKARKLADRLYQDAQAANIIPLTRFELNEPDSDKHILMAADSEELSGRSLQCLATLYSDDPEIIMRVMRDLEHNQDYLHLISDKKEYASNVMVQLPELGKEFVTDEDGFIRFEEKLIGDYDKLKWQIKLPSAVFKLQPLMYDPEKVESTQDTIIENEKGDKIQISMMKKTEGLEIALRVLKFEGSDEFRAAKVIVSQNKENKMYNLKPSEKVIYKIVDSTDVINIRLFSK